MKRWGLIVSMVAVGAGVVACGDDENKGRLADAPPGVVDSATIDAVAALQPVTVTVTNAGQPTKDLQVYFQNADSSMVSAPKTDADGKASAVMAPGGFVTVFDPDTSNGSGSFQNQIATFAGVKPGDNLLDDLNPVGGTEPVSISFDVTVPDELNGHHYILYSTCIDEGNIEIGQGQVVIAKALKAKSRVGSVAAQPVVVGTVTLSGCGNAADLLVVSRDGDNVITSWQYKPAVAVADGQPVTFIDAYQPAVATTFDYTKIPDTIGSLLTSRTLYTTHGSLFTSDEQSAQIDGTEAIITLPMPAPANVPAVTATTDEPNTGFGRQNFTEWGPNAATYDMAYGDVALSAWTTRPDLDIGSHAITWSEQAAVAGDLTLGTYTNSRMDPDGGRHNWTWRIVGPYTAGVLAFPALPTTVYDFNPKDGDGPFVQRLTVAKAPGGYDGVRATAFDNDVPREAVGPTGRIIVEDLFSRPQITRATARPTARAPRQAVHKRLSPGAR